MEKIWLNNNFKKINKNRKKSIDKYKRITYNKITIKREEKTKSSIKKFHKQQRFQTECARHEESNGLLKRNLPERYSAWSTEKTWKAQKGEMEEKKLNKEVKSIGRREMSGRIDWKKSIRPLAVMLAAWENWGWSSMKMLQAGAGRIRDIQPVSLGVFQGKDISGNSFVGGEVPRQVGSVGPDTTLRLFHLLWGGLSFSGIAEGIMSRSWFRIRYT